MTFDVFSGRANPSWRFPPVVARQVFDLMNDIGVLRNHSQRVSSRLGYRGTHIVLPAEIAVKYRHPTFVHLSAEVFDHTPLFKELLVISRLVGFIGLDEFWKIVHLIHGILQRRPSPSPSPALQAEKDAGGCAFEMLPFDPAPWNDPKYIRTNNCYAYASNKLALYPSKPQPGAATGKQYTDPPTGPDVRAAAKRDGAHDAGDCFPDTEAPRSLVAIVIWPGEDYHWYRKQTDCWGHKPGETPARNVDDSGVVITNPETCNRGPYTEFHGYMLMPKSQKVAA
jgi:hypothetical protein